MNRIALWWLCALMFTIPLENTIALNGVATSARIVGFIALGFCLCSILLRGRVHVPDAVHVLCGCFVLLIVVSLGWTQDQQMTITRAMTFVQLLGMMFLISEMAETSTDQEALLAWLVAGAIVASLATVYSYLTGSSIQHGDGSRFAAAGCDANEIALTLALAIPAAWYVGGKSRRPSARIFFRGSVFLLMFAIVLTGSRGGMVASLVALLIIPALRTKQTISLTAFAALLAGIIAVSFVPAENWERIFSIRNELLTGTLTHRTEIWSAGLKHFCQHPVFGVGAGAFAKSVADLAGGAVTANGTPTVAHNTYLSVLVELGVVGFALLLSILVLTWRRIIQLPKLERRLWAISLFTWSIGVVGLTWEHRKMTWVVLSLILAQARVISVAKYSGHRKAAY